MFEKILSKNLGKSHEVRVEKSTYTFSNGTETYIYVMVINHNVCCESKEYFDTVEEAVEFFHRFKKVSDCKNFIKNNIFPTM